MYRSISHYDEGQELALKYVWSVLQVAAEVAHDVFIILYSHMQGTDHGNKTILEYCKEASLRSVHHELLDEGYSRDYFIVSPKKAEYFDLKVTRKLMERIIAAKLECKPMSKILGIMKKLVYLRNDLCHMKLQPLAAKEYKTKTETMWKDLKTMYELAEQITATSIQIRLTQKLNKIFCSLLDITREPVEKETDLQASLQSTLTDTRVQNIYKLQSFVQNINKLQSYNNNKYDGRNANDTADSNNNNAKRHMGDKVTTQHARSSISAVDARVEPTQEHHCQALDDQISQNPRTGDMSETVSILEMDDKHCTAKLENRRQDRKVNLDVDKSTQVNLDEEEMYNRLFYRVKKKRRTRSRNKSTSISNEERVNCENPTSPNDPECSLISGNNEAKGNMQDNNEEKKDSKQDIKQDNKDNNQDNKENDLDNKDNNQDNEVNDHDNEDNNQDKKDIKQDNEDNNQENKDNNLDSKQDNNQENKDNNLDSKQDNNQDSRESNTYEFQDADKPSATQKVKNDHISTNDCDSNYWDAKQEWWFLFMPVHLLFVFMVIPVFGIHFLIEVLYGLCEQVNQKYQKEKLRRELEEQKMTQEEKEEKDKAFKRLLLTLIVMLVRIIYEVWNYSEQDTTNL